MRTKAPPALTAGNYVPGTRVVGPRLFAGADLSAKLRQSFNTRFAEALEEAIAIKRRLTRLYVRREVEGRLLSTDGLVLGEPGAIEVERSWGGWQAECAVPFEGEAWLLDARTASSPPRPLHGRAAGRTLRIMVEGEEGAERLIAPFITSEIEAIAAHAAVQREAVAEYNRYVSESASAMVASHWPTLLKIQARAYEVQKERSRREIEAAAACLDTPALWRKLRRQMSL